MKRTDKDYANCNEMENPTEYVQFTMLTMSEFSYGSVHFPDGIDMRMLGYDMYGVEDDCLALADYSNMKHYNLVNHDDLVKCAAFHICNDNVDEIKYLVDEYGLSIDDIICGVSLSELSCRTGAVNCLQYLISNGSDLSIISNDCNKDFETKKNMLMVACDSGCNNVHKIIEILLEQNFDINEKEPKTGKTALMFAASKCTFTSNVSTKFAMPILLSANARLDIKDNDGKEAVHHVGAGAGDGDGLTIKLLLEPFDKLYPEKTRAINACYELDYKKVLEFTSKINDEIFSELCNKVILNQSIGRNKDLAKELLEKFEYNVYFGGDNPLDNPIGRIVVSGYSDLLAEAIKNKVSVFRINDQGGTHLHTAAKYGQEDICTILIDACIDVNQYDFNDKYAIDHSHENHYHETSKNLLNHGSELPRNVSSKSIIDDLIKDRKEYDKEMDEEFNKSKKRDVGGGRND